ncbi:hypothetical protein [Burkholderia sp. 22313]|uniref:hypothetical protein n=1 Tax=Burkholderia sp. 22313 TaxID=3453908 RepID=UPI003F8612D1
MKLMGGSAKRCCLAFAAMRRRGARAGRSPSLDETVRCDRMPMAARADVTAGGPIARNPTRKGAGIGRQRRRDTRFPPEIRRFVEFYQAFGGHYLIFEHFH